MSTPEQGGAAAVDLRLAGPALAAWGAAALALGLPGVWTAAGAGLAVAVAGALLLAASRRPQPLWQVGTAAAAALLCAAAGAGVAGLERAEARAGPVAGLAREHARVLAELTVGSDPRVTRGGSGPPGVALDAVETRVTGPHGVTS
ncbi:MBL fold metallo-hydrolase, partial [Streptomyces lavendulae]